MTPLELRRLRALKTPRGVQRALDAMPYHRAQTAWSPRRVLREGTAHCLEGAIFAAVALRVLGFPPLLLDLEAVQDMDHVIAVFRARGRWGAIAKSNHSGLRLRTYSTSGTAVSSTKGPLPIACFVGSYDPASASRGKIHEYEGEASVLVNGA